MEDLKNSGLAASSGPAENSGPAGNSGPAAGASSETEGAARGRSRRKPGTGAPDPNRKKKAVMAGVIAAGAAVVLAGAYTYIGANYRSAFFNGTVINGIDVSGKSVGEVQDMIARETEGYVLTIQERGGRTESIEGTAIGLRAEFDGSLEGILAEQNPFAWLPAWIQGNSYEIPALVVWDEDALSQAIAGLECLDTEKTDQPQNARISDYTAGSGYFIVEEIQGNAADPEKLDAAVRDAVTSLRSELSLEEAGVYAEPSVTAEDENLKALLAEYNRLAGVTITYTFGDKTEVLNGETISQWLSDDGSQVTISEEGAAEYVQTLATKYNTAYRAKSLKTSYGPTVTISRGNYGWRINQGEEKTALMAMIQAGESGEREPVYSQKGASHGENDYGDTYVEINLTAQHLFFYKAGKMLVESDFVSGNSSRGWTTPPGAFPLTYKERNATLKGEGYRTPVSYWMPFNGGIGLHDANWRSEFGGTIYKTNGSHGCINLPPSVAKTIYENISQGDPVLCYELAGTEQSGTTGAGGKPTETKPAETQPAETAPAETQPAETQPVETTPAETQPAETAPAETQPAETKPAETQPSQTAPTEAQPAGPGEPGAMNPQETPAVGPGAGL